MFTSCSFRAIELELGNVLSALAKLWFIMRTNRWTAWLHQPLKNLFSSGSKKDVTCFNFLGFLLSNYLLLIVTRFFLLLLVTFDFRKNFCKSFWWKRSFVLWVIVVLSGTWFAFPLKLHFSTCLIHFTSLSSSTTKKLRRLIFHI